MGIPGCERTLETIVWDVAKQRIHRRLPDLNDRVNRVYISHDGRYLAVGVEVAREISDFKRERSDLTVWDLESGNQVRTLRNLSSTNPVAISPDGHHLAVVEYPHEVKVIDLP
jgi:WD40 repeat protein